MRKKLLVLAMVTTLVLLELSSLVPTGRSVERSGATTPEEIMLERNGLLWINIKGFTGSITTSLRIEDLKAPHGNDSVVFGTTSGIYIIDIDTGEVFNRIPVSSPVTSVFIGPDGDGDGVKEVGYTCVDQIRPNVVLASSVTGERIWEFAPKEEVYTSNLGWHREETRSWDSEELLTGEVPKVLVTSWRSIYALDMVTGEKLWSHTGSNDFWKITLTSDLDDDGERDVLVSTQEGALRAVSSKNGKLIWKCSLEEGYPYTASMAFAKLKFYSPKSLWEPVIIDDVTGDGVDDIAVASEMGVVYGVNGAKGKKLWEKEVLSLTKNDKKEMTSFFSENFGNILVRALGDLDGDGLDDISVLTAPGNDEKDVGKGSLLVLSTGESPAKRIIADKKSAPQFPLEGIADCMVTDDMTGDGYEDLLVVSEGQLTILDPKEGNFSVSIFTHPFFKANEDSFRENVQIVPVEKGSHEKLLVTYGSNGVFLIDTGTDEIIWDFLEKDQVEVSTIGDINAMGMSDILVTTYIKYNELLVRGIYAVSSENGETLWEKKNRLDELETNSFHNIRVLGDVNEDGINDLSGFLQEEFGNKQDWNRYEGHSTYNLSKHSRVFVISGRDGEYIWKENLTTPFINPLLTPETGLYDDSNSIFKRIGSVDPVGDMDGDGIGDLLVLGEGYWGGRSSIPKLYLLSGTNGSVAWIREYSRGEHDGGDDHSWLATNFRAETSANGTIRWESSIDGDMGEGEKTDHVLSTGNHTITASLYDDDRIVDRDNIVLNVHPEEGFTAEAHSDTLKGVAGDPIRLNAWGPDEAGYTWHSDIQGIISREREEEVFLNSGIHNVTLRAEFEGRVFWQTLQITMVPRGETVFAIRAEIEGQNVDTLPHDVFITDGKATSLFVFERYDQGKETVGYNFSWSSDLDGELGAGDRVDATLSPGEHQISVDIYDTGKEESTFLERLRYNITVLDGMTPVPDFFTGNQGRVNDHLFENHRLVSFDASSSKASADDPMEHIIVDYNWSVDGEFAGNRSDLNHYFNRSGDHTVSLSVINELGRSSAIVRTVSSFTDVIPEVSISGDELGVSFDTLQPTSLSAEGRNVSFERYLWISDVDGILEPSSQSMNSYLSEGTHNITLLGYAASGYFAQDTAVIEVKRGPDLMPRIDFPGLDGREPDIRDGLTFRANLNVYTQGRGISTDALPIHWKIDGNEVAAGKEVDLTCEAGWHELEAYFEDYGQTGTARRNIFVREIGAPFVVISNPTNNTATMQNITFNYETRGDVSVDNVSWSLGDGNTSFDHSFSYAYSRAGRYNVTLAARNDANGTYDNRTIMIEVIRDGYPVPGFVMTPASDATTITNITFDSSGSHHSTGGTIVNRTWDFGDGSPAVTGLTAYHTYRDEGEYSVSLSLEDDNGNISLLERNVAVSWGAHPVFQRIYFNDVSSPNDGDHPSALSRDEVNISTDPLFFIIPPSLYSLVYHSDRDGYLGSGKWVRSSLSPGLHEITATFLRDGESAVRCSRKITVYDDEEPIIRLIAWEETDGYSHGGSSFPAGHDIEFDISGSPGTADSNLAGTFDEITYTFSGTEVQDNPNVVRGNPATHYFTALGDHWVKVDVRNNYGRIATRTYPLHIYQARVEVRMTNPGEGKHIGQGSQSFEFSIDTNPSNAGFSPEEMLNITWVSSRDGFLGSGRDLAPYLTEGRHNITVNADNGKGLNANDTASVWIKAGSEPVALITNEELRRQIYSPEEDVSLYGYELSSVQQTFRWHSSIDGALGTGNWLNVPLSPGIHRITLETFITEEEIDTDHIFVKVSGDVPLIRIREPNNNSYVRGLFVPGGGAGGGKVEDTGKVEFLSPESNSYLLIQQANGSYHVITAGWDRIYCGLIKKDGTSIERPIWTFPDTFLGELGGTTENKDDPKESLKISDHFPFIENFDASKIELIGDMNGDGVDELGIQYWGPGSNGMISLDPLTGIPLNLDTSTDPQFNALRDMERYSFARTSTEGEDTMFGDDYDKDGYKDIITYDRWGEWERGSAIRAISSRDNTLIWEYHGLFARVQDNDENALPVTFVEDINGDGIDDVAVASVSEILLLDGSNGKEIEKHKYQKSPVRVEDDSNPPPVSFITEVDDFTGDGKKDLVLLYEVETEMGDVTKLKMIDTGNYVSFRTLPMPVANILSSSDVNGDGKADLMLGTSDLIFRLDSTFGLNILSPAGKKVSGDRVTVKWDKKDVICEIFVDRISWGYYDDGKAELTFTGGRHIIEVRLTDDFGGTVSDTVVIVVPESTLPSVINYTIIGVLVILFLLSYLLPMVTRAKREKKMEKVKVEHETEEESGGDEFLHSARKNMTRVWTKEKTDINISSVLFEDDDTDDDEWAIDEGPHDDPGPPGDYEDRSGGSYRDNKRGKAPGGGGPIEWDKRYSGEEGGEWLD